MRRGRTGDRVVWKFPLRRWSIFIDVPQGAEIVNVGVQGTPPIEHVCVWAICDPHSMPVSRRVYAVESGERIPSDVAYVGTARMADGQVFHVFDAGERAA